MPMLLLLGGSSEAIDLASFDGATPIVGPYYVGTPTGETIDLASFDGATPIAGIGISNVDPNPDPFIPQMYAELWSSTGVFISSLETQSGVNFQDALNDTGSGSLTLQLDDPDVALLVPGTEVRCYMWGDVVFTWEILQKPRIRRYDPGEEAQHTLQVAGRGRSILLDKATIYPPKGLSNAINAQHRIYSFASVDFPNAGTWGTAWQGTQANVVDPERASFIEYTSELEGGEEVVETVIVPAPIGWPVPEAFWIWGQADTYPTGRNYFRQTFTLTSEQTVAFFVTADNLYTLYLDGTPILGETEFVSCWQEYKRQDMTLPAGTYTVAAIAYNAPWPPEYSNPAGFIFACCVVDRDNEIVSNILVSDASWYALPYPDPDPGWTPGQILLDAIGEAQARGSLAGFTVDFTESNDSLGNPWPFLPGFSIPIGNSVLDVLNGLVDQGWVDWRVKPGGKLLQMFNQTAIATESGITYQATGNVDTQTIRGQDFIPQIEPINRYLVKWSNGYFMIEDTVSQAAYGEFEGFMTVDSVSFDDAVSQATVVLNENAEPRYAIVADIAPLAEADSPYAAYGVGEKVRVSSPEDVLTYYQVHAITVQQTELGRAEMTLELNARINQQQREDFELLQGIGRGLVGDTKQRNSYMAFNKALGITE